MRLGGPKCVLRPNSWATPPGWTPYSGKTRLLLLFPCGWRSCRRQRQLWGLQRPLPLRVEELQRDKDGAVRTGDVVELADIVPAVFSEPERAALFEPPSGFTRYASILDLLLYALAV